MDFEGDGDVCVCAAPARLCQCSQYDNNIPARTATLSPAPPWWAEPRPVIDGKKPKLILSIRVFFFLFFILFFHPFPFLPSFFFKKKAPSGGAWSRWITYVAFATFYGDTSTRLARQLLVRAPFHLPSLNPKKFTLT